MNTYRVDRNNQNVTPCGMNGILYIGDDSEEAKKVFENAEPGVDSWGQPNETYGVLYSVWNPEKKEYIVKRVKLLREN